MSLLSILTVWFGFFRSVRECNQETKRKCKTVPVQIVVRVPAKTCPKSVGKSTLDNPGNLGDDIGTFDAGHESSFEVVVSDQSVSDVADNESNFDAGSSGEETTLDNADNESNSDIGSFDEVTNPDNADTESNSDIGSSGDVDLDYTETRSDDIQTRSASLP